MEASILSTRSADRARSNWRSNLYFERFTSCESPFHGDSIRENKRPSSHEKPLSVPNGVVGKGRLALNLLRGHELNFPHAHLLCPFRVYVSIETASEHRGFLGANAALLARILSF